MGFADNIGSVAVDATFAAFGKAASYVPPGGGTALSCVVIRDVRDPDAALPQGLPEAGVMTLEVRASEIAQPTMDGVFTLGGGGLQLIVSDRPMKSDPDGLVWRMWVI